MFQIGGAIECALDNKIYGANTISLFQDGSAFYIFLALGYFLFDVFINPMIFILLVILEITYYFVQASVASSGLLIWWIPIVNLIPLSSATLWWLPVVPYYILLGVYV